MRHLERFQDNDCDSIGVTARDPEIASVGELEVSGLSAYN